MRRKNTLPHQQAIVMNHPLDRQRFVKGRSAMKCFLICVLTVFGFASAYPQLSVSRSTFAPLGRSNGEGLSVTSSVGYAMGGTSSNGGLLLTHGTLFPGLLVSSEGNLLYFDVICEQNGGPAIVRWSTLVETDMAGFNIFRGEPSGDGWTVGVQLNSTLLAAQGDEFNGASYTFNDPSVYTYGSGQRAYFLEEVTLNGTKTLHGPIILEIDPSPSTVLDWMMF